LPGGCLLGTRATDMHEQAFRALGAQVSNAHGYLIAKSVGPTLVGADIDFRQPSVGATKNAMLASVLARGTTTLRNVAMEPEVVDLANFLVAMGARIAGQGTDTIVIEGVRELHGVEYEVIPDRIVTGTLLLDLDDPTRVVGYSRTPLLSPGRDEQDGYVPNVVYSCGAFLHDGLVWIPYGIDDCRIGVAYVPLGGVLADLRSAS